MTLRELLWMLEGQLEHAWAHTSSLIAMMFNSHRTSRNDKFIRPDQVNPMRRGKQTVQPGGMAALKAIFSKKKGA